MTKIFWSLYYNLIEVTTWAGLTLFDDILTTLLSMFAGYHIACLVLLKLLSSEYYLADYCLFSCPYYVIFVNCQLLNGIL
jgi:hypothetical protein